MVSHRFENFLSRSKEALRAGVEDHNDNPAVKYAASLYREYLRGFLRRYIPLLNTTVQIALTYRCQCRCVHCGVILYRQKAKEELTAGDVIKLIDEVKTLGAAAVYFFGGEPLLLPDLTDYICHAKKKRLRVSLDTNGYLLNEAMVKRLKDAGTDIVGVSLDSPFGDIHDELRGLKGLFRKAVAGIEQCVKHNMNCYISTYATGERLKNGELERLIALAKSLGVKTRISAPTLCGNLADQDSFMLSPAEVNLLRDHLEKDRVYWEMERIDCKDKPFVCAAFAREYFHVSAYGDLQPCCFFPISFGNIREEHLLGIVRRMWDSDMFADYREHTCPANDEVLRRRFQELVESGGLYPYPKNFGDFPSTFDEGQG